MPQRKNLNQLLKERSDAVNQYINIILKSWFKESFHTKITSYLFDIIKESCNYFNEQGQKSNFSINSIEFPNNSFLKSVENKYLKYKYFHEECEVPDNNISLKNQVIQKISENINIIRLKIIRGNDACLGDNHYRQENKEIFTHLRNADNNLFDYIISNNKQLQDIKEIREKEGQHNLANSESETKESSRNILKRSRSIDAEIESHPSDKKTKLEAANDTVQQPQTTVSASSDSTSQPLIEGNKTSNLSRSTG
ncbi:hypothetical protein N9O56_00215 [Rickettsiales bacterium]|nr:hypothetical protein [Rickettsiales bacterium]